jgi:magnesium transporter
MITSVSPADIQQAIESRDFSTVRDALGDYPPLVVAELIADLPPKDQAVVIRILPRDLAADVFEYLDREAQEELLKAMGREEVVRILTDMSPDDRTALLEELPGSLTKQLVSLLSPEERTVALSLLGYPEDSVGRLMTPDYLAIHQDWTVSEVLEHVRRYGHYSETINVLYVIDERGRLIDDIRIREFLFAPLDTRVSDLMDYQYVALRTTDDQETAVATFRRHDRSVLPVVDSTGLLVGIVTADDVLDVAEEEATEDIHKLGGVEALDEPYMQISLLRMVRKRGVWLIVLLLGQMLTATALGFFETEMERAIVLTLFIPLIISSGGNSGSQAATLVIRALSLGEITLRDWWRVMRREVLTGLTLGVILGIFGFLRIALWSTFGAPYGPFWPLIALTIALSLIGIVLWGTLMGSMLPFVLQRLGADPATSSAPFVATLVDVTGIIIYFSVALLVLSGTLL